MDNHPRAGPAIKMLWYQPFKITSYLTEAAELDRTAAKAFKTTISACTMDKLRDGGVYFLLA